MFIGHYAVGFAAKKVAPKVSLGTLFLSIQLLDLIWPVLIILGVEHVRIDPGNTAFTPLDFFDYPISHSMVTSLLWSVALGVIYYLVKKYPKGAWVVGAGVFSHWVLDFITHRPDLPLSPWSSTYFGLGLWNSYLWSVVVEGTIFLAGVIIYVRSTVAKDKTGKYALWSLVGFLSLAWIINMVGPPPPNVEAIGYSALLLWLLVPWGYWIDRHRTITSKE
jgi:LexA-binding, inner membrane-associated putative hydrolase